MTVDGVPDLYPSEPLPVRLMNTVWAGANQVHDSLRSVAQLQQWARQCGLARASGLTRVDLERARLLRDALRRLAAALLDDRRPGAVRADWSAGEALEVLNDFLGACVPEARFAGDTGLRRGWRLSVRGFERELVEIALDAADLLAQGDSRLGVCYGPGCVLYFQRMPVRREWCSAGCGNRARVARHYRRHKDGPGERQDGA